MSIYYIDKNGTERVSGGRVLAYILGTLLTVVLMTFAIMWSYKAYNRHQATADAHNNAKIARIAAENEQYVNELRIKAQEQKVQIAKQDAEIRYTEATGIRRAQDEISKTLTPLYVQHEWIEAYKANPPGSTVYIPSGESGVPVVRTAP